MVNLCFFRLDDQYLLYVLIIYYFVIIQNVHEKIIRYMCYDLNILNICFYLDILSVFHEEQVLEKKYMK